MKQLQWADTTVVAVASLNTLDGKTTGTINESTIQPLGTAADLNTAYHQESRLRK